LGYRRVFIVSNDNQIGANIMEYKNLCVKCGDHVIYGRWLLGFSTCLKCGEAIARETKHTIAPMHKSNYVVITNKEDLKGLNNKGGNVR
jgi:ribosomal protein L37AE/L43A